MQNVDRLIEGLAACTTAAEIVELFSGTIKAIGYHGFDAYSFAVETINNVDQNGNFVVCDYDMKLIGDYVRDGWMQMCPTIDETAAGKVPFDYVAFLHRCPQNASVRWQKFMLKAFDVRHAWLVPLSTVSVNKGVTVYLRGRGAKTAEFFASTRHEIHLLASYLMQALDGAHGISGGNGHERQLRPDISSREIDCLHWAARGKSNREIGDILGVSENTVRFHLKNAFRKLDVTSRSQAVSEALRAGLISG
ncbi:helix-turn-helix transcriptional regulator [Mesorhizobium sp. Z1-4]|uniref:response regulator transcription factor n=1 Tax=Mesorhizobium sp. Z1-4 TaxID=2448478 RepID=UPI000FD7B5B5|nr:helix-turn-helix transcriptional regulator [Mesorhizobium sp. Z1-4]